MDLSNGEALNRHEPERIFAANFHCRVTVSLMKRLADEMKIKQQAEADIAKLKSKMTEAQRQMAQPFYNHRL